MLKKRSSQHPVLAALLPTKHFSCNFATKTTMQLTFSHYVFFFWCRNRSLFFVSHNVLLFCSSPWVRLKCAIERSCWVTLRILCALFSTAFWYILKCILRAFCGPITLNMCCFLSTEHTYNTYTHTHTHKTPINQFRCMDCSNGLCDMLYEYYQQF